MHPATPLLLVSVLVSVGTTLGFEPSSLHRTAYDKRSDENIVNGEETDGEISDGNLGNEENSEEESYPVQMPQCLSRGGVCTSKKNCPSGHFLNLQALEPALCGHQDGVVCCKPTFVGHQEVLQMDACNHKAAFCTRTAACPAEAQLDNPLLCGDQSEVVCCRSTQNKKNSVDFKSESKNELHVHNSNGLEYGDPDADVVPVERRALGATKRKAISRIRKSPVYQLMTLGVAKRHQPTCAEVRGLCVEMERCPEGDIVADQKFCSGDESIVCCRLSRMTVGGPTFKYVSFPDGGTDPEDMNPI